MFSREFPFWSCLFPPFFLFKKRRRWGSNATCFGATQKIRQLFFSIFFFFKEKLLTEWLTDRQTDWRTCCRRNFFFFPVKTLKVERKEKIETSSTCCKTLTDMAPQTLISNRSLALHMSPFFPLLAYSGGGCVKAKWVNNTRSCLSRCFSLDKYKRLYFLMLMSI